MDRWEFSHGRIGANAPSWLTFEVHRPYLDGAGSPLATVHSRSGLLAARRFRQRRPTALRFGMSMPASYRALLTEESRLTAYRVRTPAELPADIASAEWLTMAAAVEAGNDLDDTDRAGLAQWLIATCLHDAVVDLLPVDAREMECSEPVKAAQQWARACALFAREGLSDRTTAAYRILIDNPVPTVPHAQAVAGWGYLLARHAADDSASSMYLARAGELLKSLSGELSPFEHAILRARLQLREVMAAERHRDFALAWRLLSSASDVLAEATPVDEDDEEIAVEMRRRLIDRQVDIAVRREDREAERLGIAEGIELDPYDVKIRMQAAQADERDGDDEKALSGFLLASRLGPYGTAFALLGAARCAERLGHNEFARVLAERAFRTSPRSVQTRDALLRLCADDEPMANLVRRAASAERRYENSPLYQMYAAYFNLGESQSPCLYASLPSQAYEFATQGALPFMNQQRLMPPAFRANLIRESGLTEFAVSHPEDLAAELRTEAWDQLCQWIAEFDTAPPDRRFLTATVLFRLGFGRLVLDLIPPKPVAGLTDPLELQMQHWRDVVRYVGSVGGRTVTPTASFEVADHPDCPARLRYTIAIFAVVFHARETKSLDEAVRWREKAQQSLNELLASDDHTPFEKAMMESRFYRSVTYVPFLQRDRDKLTREMDRAEELARAVRPSSPYEDFLARENLRACVESRSKEAFGFGDNDLGHRRVLEVLDIDPYEPKSHMELAEVLLPQGDALGAANSYLRTARLGPIATARGYAAAGECFERAGLMTLAEDCFVQALRVDPYAVSAARGWRRVATAVPELAADYADSLERWGEARKAARTP